ncbi:hypothetical protein GGI20_005357 [Coemansia sp. BCRC 34301]|nr:hypothetical protein GGI20_005357 [Coemansia sp. BCRC 34301]
MAQNMRPYDAAAAERSIMQLLPSSQHHRQNHGTSMNHFGANVAAQASLAVCHHQQQQLMSPPASGHSMAQQPAPSGEQLKQSFYNPYHVKHRRRTTKEQLSLLEGTFEHTPKPSSELRKSLAGTLCMTAREVQIWFQNRRAKQKNIIMRATSATKTSADCSPVLSPTDRVSPAAKLERAASAEHLAGSMAGKDALRRHSDIPVSYVHCEKPAAATCGPIENQLAVAAAALLPATAMVATMPTTAHASPPPALATQPPAYLQQSMLFQHTLDAAMAAASSSSMMPCAMPTNHPPPTLLPQQVQKKHKHSAVGNTDRYHSARVHQEAFDGTNKLPLKPDDFSHSGDDQFSMLDPSNLPTFMMPMHAGGPSMVGSSSSGPSMSFSSPGYQSMPSAMNLNSSSGMFQYTPYSSQSQQSGLPHPSMPSTDMSTLFSGLLGLSPTSPYSSMPPPPIGSYGVPALASGSSNAASDLAAYNTSFYQALLLMNPQSPTAPGAAAMPPPLGRQRPCAGASQLHVPPEMSPLSPAESVAALASSPPGSHRQMNLCVDTSAALMSPSAAPTSAFAPYESQGHAKPQQAPPSLLHQQQRPGAIFLPSDTNTAAASALATTMYPHLVAMAATDPAELFGPVSGGNGSGSSVL